MRRSIALALAGLLALAATAQAQDLRQISVTGEGRVEAAPDMATITLGVTQQAPEASAAMRAASEATARILTRLGTLDIAPRDVQTRNISIDPVWSNRVETAPGAAPEITGFVASNTVIVRVRDLASLGGLLDAVTQEGANQLGGLSFGLAEPRALEAEARARAVADAIARAETLAEAAGVPLGRVQQITEQTGRGGPVMMEMASSMRDGGVPVSPGEITLSATVSMTFAIDAVR